LSLRSALRAWPNEIAQPERAAVARVARRLRLGDSVTGALSVARGALGADGEALATVLSLHERLGGDPPRSLEELASGIDRRRDFVAQARGASAGARLSGRVVAGLPLLGLPAVPLSRAPLLDVVGIGLTLAGLGLALGGLVWIERLVPRPPAEDPACLVASLLASALRAGLPLQAALAAVTERPPEKLADEARRVRRRVRLGAPWPAALASSHDDFLAQLGRLLYRVGSAGAPAAEALEALAERRRGQIHAEFDEKLRRAPVLMVVPLTLVVLPSFVVLGVVPFLRSLT
jgi:Flp pilus assembly protein TadB